MNPRRVHARFRQHRPSVDFAQCEWTHLFSDGCLNEERLRTMLSTLETSHFLIHVQRKIGDYLPFEEALAFIRENIGKSTIYIGDRNFAGLVVVAQNGVATTLPPDKGI
jgi:hypothetical protein